MWDLEHSQGEKAKCSMKQYFLECSVFPLFSTNDSLEWRVWTLINSEEQPMEDNIVQLTIAFLLYLLQLFPSLKTY